MAKRRKRCPRCGQLGARRILYGLPAPSEEMFRQLDAGEIELGGCCVWENMPEWHCPHCDYQWNKAGAATIEPGREPLL